MNMTIITILLAILLDKIPTIEKLKQYSWANEYVAMILKFLPEGGETFSRWRPLIALLPMIVVLFVLEKYLTHDLNGFLGFLLNVMVLTYCLGPSQIADYFLCFFMKNNKTPITIDAEPISDEASSNTVDFIVKIHEEVFGVIFWFIVLGAAGALIYRLVLSLKKSTANADSVLFESHKAFADYLELLNWPSVRLLGLCLSLGGEFVQTFSLWFQGFLTPPENNVDYLKNCAKASLENEESDQGVEQLFHRSMLIFFVILALMTLASWLS